jgi:hypothetical protein
MRNAAEWVAARRAAISSRPCSSTTRTIGGHHLLSDSMPVLAQRLAAHGIGRRDLRVELGEATFSGVEPLQFGRELLARRCDKQTEPGKHCSKPMLWGKEGDTALGHGCGELGARRMWVGRWTLGDSS